MKKSGLLTVALMCASVMLGFSACSDDKPGAMEDPEPAVAVTNVALDGFSDGQQTLTGLKDGIYTLRFYAKGEGEGYVEANGKKTALVYSPDITTEQYVRGIVVNGGSCTIKINGVATDVFSYIKLLKTGSETTLLKGADISELTYVEQNGGKYYWDDTETDCVELLKKGGVNVVRLRLYNEPGKYTYKGYDLPEGIQTEEDILNLAKRAKAQDMQIMLTFHYSDFWTNGGDQYVPHAWEQYVTDDLDGTAMKQAIYDYTYAFMEKMKAQGTSPEYVSLGNESQNGMLFPMAGPLESQHADYWKRVRNLADFYNAGYDAVKASAPQARVIIHLNGAGNSNGTNYDSYFTLMNDWKVKYDIIGSSYYPFYTGKDAATISKWAASLTEKFKKDLIFMEVGYAWQQTTHDNVPGQLSNNYPYGMTRDGQKQFMLELTNEIKRVDSQRILGYVYWDPIFIPAGNTGWAVGQTNVVSNTTLFDFQGNALQVFDALMNNN